MPLLDFGPHEQRQTRRRQATQYHAQAAGRLNLLQGRDNLALRVFSAAKNRPKESRSLLVKLYLRNRTQLIALDELRKDGSVRTIEQEIELLAKKKWPQAGRIDIGTKLSHAWHGDLVQPMTGYSILVCCPKGKLITQLKATTLESLRRKVLATPTIND